MEKGDSLNNIARFTMEKVKIELTVPDFFQTLIYILMATSFITLAIIFLQVLRGQEEKTD